MALTETRTASAIAEDRLRLAAQVQGLRDELVSAPDEVRAEKSADLSSLMDQLERCDSEYQLAASLERANQMIEKMARQPNRPEPTVYGANVQYQPARVSYDGRVLDNGGLADPSDKSALASPEYHQAFKALIQARGRIELVKSSSLRNMLEVYGKGGDFGLPSNEFYMPFSKDMTLGTTTNGTNTVTPDFRFDVIVGRTVAPVMTRICRVINTNVNQVTFPRDSNTNNITTAPQYGTTFRPFMGETVNTTLSKIDTGPFTQLTIPVNTGTMYTDVSADFFADVAGISNYIQTEASKAFAAVVDNQVINGVTASTEAEGVISNSSVGITKTGSNNTLVASKVIDGFYALADQYATNLSWVMRRATHGKLVALNDTTNRSLFLGSADSGYVQGITPSIMGQPVYFNGFVPASGASTPKSIVLGDFNEYILLLRQGFTVAIDEVSLAYANRVRIAVKYRFGGAVRDPRAFQIIQELV